MLDIILKLCVISLFVGMVIYIAYTIELDDKAAQKKV